MKKNNVSTQNWLTKKLDLENQIKAQSESMPNVNAGISKQIEAADARTRMDSFVSQYGPENRFSENQERTYGILKRDFESKQKIAEEATGKYQQAKAELDRLKDELKSLQPPVDDDFNASGIELLIKKSTGPWISMIEEACAAIDKLKAKRSDFAKELQRINSAPATLDEQSLLDADISAHHALKKVHKESREKVESVEDLMQQVDQVISEKDKHLKKLRADFSAALRSVVMQYTTIAAKEIAKQLRQVIETDAFYADNFGRACNEMIQRAGANPADVFGNPSFPDLKTSPLHGQFRLKEAIEQFVSGIAA